MFNAGGWDLPVLPDTSRCKKKLNIAIAESFLVLQVRTITQPYGNDQTTKSITSISSKLLKSSYLGYTRKSHIVTALMLIMNLLYSND